jgi:hypothetical protein
MSEFIILGWEWTTSTSVWIWFGSLTLVEWCLLYIVFALPNVGK